MSGEHCEHCDLPRAQCVHGSPAPREVAHASGPTIDALYDGVCMMSSSPYAAGDSITYSEEAGGWCHTGCTDAIPPPDLGFDELV